MTFEQGPIRPPSEAHSLLLRFTRNCPWNRCTFCPVYKGQDFSRRSLREIRQDIDSVRCIIDDLDNLAPSRGGAVQLPQDLLSRVLTSPAYNACVRHVAVWVYGGRGTVFIQDANSLVMRTQDLVAALRYLKETVPGIRRITTYARSSSLARKSLDELQEIRDAGLDRVHIGVESGADAVLTLMHKGVTAQQHIDAGRKVIAAGMTLSAYVMPGLGGVARSRAHALETARVLNAIDPHFIRLRSLRVPPRTPLHQDLITGRFELLSDDQVVQEIRLFIEALQGIRSTLTSDHIMNLFNVNYRFNHLCGLNLSASASYSNCWPGEGNRGVNFRTVPETKSSHIVRWSRSCRGKPKGCMTIRLTSRCISRRSRSRRFTRNSCSTLSIAA